ncbi:YebC/PmpR family DNA-binding transcriptional regulator [Candidatus Babeliales bacterium]|nr:YebC/PmpR family DNA-binding transcriptional regulator [Candidatus Babeliales bacterium]MCF7899568.1 YebC/PmpR family DNA-binding transcriptional regulator [Candidatus Babeliales bacterium]
MSGHSKWSTIKHKKAKEDAKRGKIFTKLIREITVAAKEGGGDVAGNARLRLIIDKAKEVNMPQDNIVRAIKKGTGELEGASYEPAIYEGYGPQGVAIIVETLSDNKKRTVSDLRHLFSKFGGTLAESGAVSWMFEHKGLIKITADNLTEDDVLEKMLDYNIDDVSMDDGIISISCDVADLDKVKKGARSAALKIEDASIEWIPKNTVEVTDKEKEESVYKFLETINDLDDVQNIYANLV